MRRFLWLLLVSTCFAQTQQNLPTLIDSYQSQTQGAADWQVVYPEPIGVGDELIVGYVVDDSATGGPVFAVTDTLGNTYSTASCKQTPLPVTNRDFCISYVNSAFAGNDTISVAIPSHFAYGIEVGRFSHLSGALDGPLFNCTFAGNGTGGGGTLACSTTTTVNNDLIVCQGGPSQYGTAGVGINGSVNEYVSYNVESTPGLMSFRHTGALGSYTATQNTYNDFSFGNHASFAIICGAFKPSPTIAIADTALPEAGNGVAYSAQLHCVGGTAAQSYSLFSGTLPTGLSLNTSTGVISGSTTAVGSSSLGFRCTDGTNTSATATMTLVVDSSFAVPFIRASVACQSITCSLGSVLANDYICALPMHGFDTHGGNGWVQADNGTNNNVTESLTGATLRRLPWVPGGENAPLTAYCVRVTASGNENILFTKNTGGSGLNWIAVSFGNAQGIFDQPTWINDGYEAASPFTFSGSFTTAVANSLLVPVTSTSYNSSESIAYGGPISLTTTANGFCCYDVTALGNALIASASTTTVSTTVTTGSPAGSFPVTAMFAVRPGLPSPSATGPIGEPEEDAPW